MKLVYLILSIFLLHGCSSIPTIELSKEQVEKLNTIQITTNPNANYKLTTLSRYRVEWTGLSYSKSSGSGTELREFTLNYLANNNIDLGEIVKAQFIGLLKNREITTQVVEYSENQLNIAINVVVLDRAHGLTDNIVASFNIAAELKNGSGETVWSYNAIPVSPFSNGGSTTIEKLFISKDSVYDFFDKAAEPMTIKLYKHFSLNI